jgi:hypothetical protein
VNRREAMLIAEWLNLIALVFFVALGFLRPLPARRRVTIVSLGIAGTLLTAGAARLRIPARDWLPALILLLVYWQAGAFFSQPSARLQAGLLSLDHRCLPAIPRMGPVARSYFELCYLFCYPMVPLGVGFLYMVDRRMDVQFYWSVVLPSAYICYGLLPFFQTLPPRVLPEDSAWVPARSRVRRFNLRVLQHGSVQANTFPSAHVASGTAASLVLLCKVPWAGAIFLWIALSIAVAAFMGRYDYLGDVILGLLLAVAVFLGVWIRPF